MAEGRKRIAEKASSKTWNYNRLAFTANGIP
jgi:hypothetical protein